MSGAYEDLVFPPALKRGDTIGLVTPSSPAPALFPTRFGRGVAALKSLGFEVRASDHCTTRIGSVAASPEERADDINRFFADDEITGIIATIGGNHSVEIIPYLDFEVIASNPKILMGYSDISALLNLVSFRARFITFYGPTLMTEFAEFPSMPAESTDGFISAACRGKDVMEISPFEYALGPAIDWGDPGESRYERQRVEPTSARTIRPGIAVGRLTGGCVEALQLFRGTDYFPNARESILILETASDAPNLEYLAKVLGDWENTGVFSSISGLIFGRKQWPLNSLDQLRELLLQVTRSNPVPTLLGLDFGHISPITTLALGANAEFDADEACLRVSLND